MGKKRKAPRASEPAGPKDVDPADARLAINSYEDIADSEDEYFMNKDRIDFDEQPKSKRQKRQEDEDDFFEASDEEIFEEDDSEASDHDPALAKGKKGIKSRRQDDDDDSEEEEGDEEDVEGDSGWWGSSKQDYYNADTIETEADALEEEQEALRLQKKKLSKMTEEDFMFDEGEWMTQTAEPTETEDVVTEVLKEPEVTEDMSAEERYRILQSRYPEFDHLADEFRELQPVLDSLTREAEGQPAKSLVVVQYWFLSAYVGALASYFAILTSPARNGDGAGKPMDPAELRDHEVMETLVSCRKAWLKVKDLMTTKAQTSDTGMLSPPEVELEAEQTTEPTKKKTKAEKALEAETKARSKAKAKKAQEIEASLADLDKLLKKPKKVSKSKAKAEFSLGQAANDEDNRSDFGEEEEMDAKAAAAKENKKKSLRFYTSQIVQKAARRAEATQNAGGDMDIPYRERIKDKQARLQAEAEKRGQKSSKLGAELDDNSSGDDDGGNGGNTDDDEYYDLVANRASAKKADKAARFEALAAAGKGDRVVEQETLGEDGKRKITYAIEKNKGLAPHRKKDVRNPRVKKRKKYEQKKKKLASMRPIYKGGEQKGGYQGELSGIKTGVVKSTKL